MAESKITSSAGGYRGDGDSEGHGAAAAKRSEASETRRGNKIMTV